MYIGVFDLVFYQILAYNIFELQFKFILNIYDAQALLGHPAVYLTFNGLLANKVCHILLRKLYNKCEVIQL